MKEKTLLFDGFFPNSVLLDTEIKIDHISGASSEDVVYLAFGAPVRRPVFQNRKLPGILRSGEKTLL